jgi:uncharacterized membrane protein
VTAVERAQPKRRAGRAASARRPEPARRERDGAIRIGIAVLALIGAGIASYLTVAHYGGARLYCPATGGGCETVESSPESKLFGVPVATLGLASYSILLASAFVRDERAILVATTLALVGVAFSGWLLYVMLVRIDAVCTWCLSNDTVSLLLAVLTVARLLTSEPETG